jgi:hypothetical protein
MKTGPYNPCAYSAFYALDFPARPSDPMDSQPVSCLAQGRHSDPALSSESSIPVLFTTASAYLPPSDLAGTLGAVAGRRSKHLKTARRPL